MAIHPPSRPTVVPNTQVGHTTPGGNSRAELPVRHNFQQRVTADQILRAFNTRSFRRENPDSRETLLAIISRSLNAQDPVPFMMYWGKGLRPVLAAPEHTCLDYLASMFGRIKDRYRPGAKMTLVFTDTHAQLNGHSQESIETYFADLVVAAEARGFQICKLSSLMSTADLDSIVPHAEDRPSDELLAGLSVSAAKWFRGEGTPEEGALLYYRANMIERRVTEASFGHTIFITFNGSSMRSLFPLNMPIFYMFSVRPGVSDKPWFLPPDFSERSRQDNVRADTAESA